MVRFPSVEWFEETASRAAADRERARRLGYVDSLVGVSVEDATGARGYVLEFAGYGVRKVREATSPEEVADFTIAGPSAAWHEMIENIRANGGADLQHTLNRLTMAGTPLRVIAADQLKQDLFFRFNQSLQAFFDAARSVPTKYAAPAPV